MIFIGNLGELKKMKKYISLINENGQEIRTKKSSNIEKMIYKKDRNLIELFKKISGQEKQRLSNFKIPKELIKNHYIKVRFFIDIIDPNYPNNIFACS